MALSRDLYRISQIIDYLYQTDLVNIILIDGYQINYGQLYYLGDVFETLFSLEILESKEPFIVNILRELADNSALTDGIIDFSSDGAVIKSFITNSNSS